MSRILGTYQIPVLRFLRFAHSPLPTTSGRRFESGRKLPKATPERVLLSCLKRQIDVLCTKRLLVIIIAGICRIIMAKYHSNKVHRLPSAAFCRMRSLGVERKCWFSTNYPCICCLFVVFLIASKRFVVCIWGIACR